MDQRPNVRAGGILLTTEKSNQCQLLVTLHLPLTTKGWAVSLLQGHGVGASSSLSIQRILVIKGPQEAVNSIPLSPRPGLHRAGWACRAQKPMFLSQSCHSQAYVSRGRLLRIPTLCNGNKCYHWCWGWAGMLAAGMQPLLGPAFSGDALHRAASVGLAQPPPPGPACTSLSASVIRPALLPQGRALFGGDWQAACAHSGGGDAHCCRQYFRGCMVTYASSRPTPYHRPQFQEVQSPE